jgi:hypothetical protein
MAHGTNRRLMREQARSFKESWELIPWPPRDEDDEYDDAMWMSDDEGEDDEVTYH